MVKTKEEIAKILMDNFDSVYCDGCRHRGYDDHCDECDRKAMGWQISEEFANVLAEEITND